MFEISFKFFRNTLLPKRIMIIQPWSLEPYSMVMIDSRLFVKIPNKEEISLFQFSG